MKTPTQWNGTKPQVGTKLFVKPSTRLLKRFMVKCETQHCWDVEAPAFQPESSGGFALRESGLDIWL
tara:strand:+ start:4151 stop:4351 length:201 start_codon:yes stop_codon:yes gene_type:complete